MEATYVGTKPEKMYAYVSQLRHLTEADTLSPLSPSTFAMVWMSVSP